MADVLVVPGEEKYIRHSMRPLQFNRLTSTTTTATSRSQGGGGRQDNEDGQQRVALARSLARLLLLYMHENGERTAYVVRTHHCSPQSTITGTS